MTVAEAGRKGGKSRAARLTKQRRSEIARLGYIASPISNIAARLENEHGQYHEFAWPSGTMSREEYDALPYKEKVKKAHVLVTLSLDQVGLRKPLNCSNCNLPGFQRVLAHHDDYSQPMRVRFLCSTCHLSLHRLSPKQQDKDHSAQTAENK